MEQTREWNVWFPWVGTAVAVAYAAYVTLKSRNDSNTKSGVDLPINSTVKKDESKVVDSFDIEDMGNKTVFCRCWRSKKFPYCDGSHNKHNESCGDNIGPLIIQRKVQ